LSDLNDVKSYGNIKVSFTLFLEASKEKEQQKRSIKHVKNQIMCFFQK
jgi:hypothetical protein